MPQFFACMSFKLLKFFHIMWAFPANWSLFVIFNSTCSWITRDLFVVWNWSCKYTPLLLCRFSSGSCSKNSFFRICQRQSKISKMLHRTVFIIAVSDICGTQKIDQKQEQRILIIALSTAQQYTRWASSITTNTCKVNQKQDQRRAIVAVGSTVRRWSLIYAVIHASR